MFVFDTDHLVELDRGSSEGIALQRRLQQATEDIATTIVSAEEQRIAATKLASGGR